MDEQVEQRFELVDDRHDHLEHRVETLEAKLSDRAARRREWLVIWLFVGEIILGIAEVGVAVWMALQHA